jgi:hypothetical protein
MIAGKPLTLLPEPGTVSAPETVAALIHRAETANASDIHLQMTPDGAVVSFRLDGLMTPATTFAPELADRVFGRIKFLAQLKTYQETPSIPAATSGWPPTQPSPAKKSCSGSSTAAPPGVSPNCNFPRR